MLPEAEVYGMKGAKKKTNPTRMATAAHIREFILLKVRIGSVVMKLQF